jgi:cell division protein ZapA
MEEESILNKNRLNVEIYGQHYQITGGTPATIKQVASLVDEKMRQIADKNPKLDTTRLAVLSACNIANDYLKLKQEHDEILDLVEDEQP